MIVPVWLTSMYAFQCPDCGDITLLEPVPVEMTDDVRREITQSHPGISPKSLKTGEWCVCPETVECLKCQKEFEAEEIVFEE